MSVYILAIDQGTTSTRACLFNKQGQVIGQAQQAFRQIFPKPGWVEHNLEDIWFTTTATIKKAIETSGIKTHEIAAIGITNQRETVGIWHAETLKPLNHAIVWQCRRTQDVTEKLKKLKYENEIRKRTGLVLDPYFSASKIQWLLKNTPQSAELIKNNQLRAGTIDCFLVNKLTSGASHKTDVSNASRTMLMNLSTLWWDEKLLKLFKVPESILPEIAPSSGRIAVTKGLGFLPDGIPISGIAGDQQAALFGQTCFEAGEAKCTFGTGSFLLMNSGSKQVVSKNRLLTTVAWKLDGEEVTYALEGGAFVCGAAVQWLRDGLGLFQHSSEIEKLAMEVPHSDGVEFVPALTGLGAPYWRSEARGVMTGLTRGTTKAHIARATLEAMALQNAEILKAMEQDLKRKLKAVKVDGGASANNLLMQLQSDYAQTTVIRPQNVETTVLGAAYLAGLGVGFWKSKSEIQKIWKVDQKFQQKIKATELKNRLARWQKAVSKA